MYVRTRVSEPSEWKPEPSMTESMRKLTAAVGIVCSSVMNASGGASSTARYVVIFFLLCVGVRRTVLPQHTHVCLYQRRAHTHPADSKAHLPASPSDADAARDVDFNGDGHGGDVHSDTGSGSGLAANIHPDDAPPAPGPSSRSDGAHARTQSLLASSTPPPPQNSICGSQPRPKPEPEPNFSTPPSAFKPTPPNKAAPKPKTKPSPYLAHARPDAIPELYDIPLGMVNRVVYGPRRTLGIQS